MVGVLGIMAAACSAAATPTPPPTPTTPSAEAFRDYTVATLRQLSSVHFIVSHEEGGTDLGGGVLLKSAEGDVLFPSGGAVVEDRADLIAKTTLIEFGLALDMAIVQIGAETYMRDPISRVWRTVEPGSLPFDFNAMNESVAEALAATTNLALAGGDERNGVSTYLLTGLVRPQAFRGLVPGAPEGEPLELEAWIGREDSLPRTVRLSGKLIDDDPPEMVRLLHLTDFDDEVSIEPPI
jgi:hypothetical protein